MCDCERGLGGGGRAWVLWFQGRPGLFEIFDSLDFAVCWEGDGG